jgi:hypothetical protein
MKRLLLLTATLFVATGAFAQNFQWGIKAGVNIANVTNSDNMADFKPALYAGLFTEFILGKHIGIQPELVYSQQGFMTTTDLSGTGMGGVVDAKYRMNYLNLPILVKLYVVKYLSIDFGPQFGYSLSRNVVIDGRTIELDEAMDAANEILGTNYKFNDFDVSFAVGLSYKIEGKFDISARYNIGLNDYVKGDPSKHSVIQVGFGYRF